MDSIFFGLGLHLDGGVDPGVAINTNGVVVEVHKAELSWDLYARSGTLNQAQIAWNDMVSDRDPYTTGSEPAVAMNRQGYIVEVHKREIGDVLYCIGGKIDGTSIQWSEEAHKYEGDGHHPAVAMNDDYQVVSVFADGDVYYKRGRFNTSDLTVEYEGQESFGTGEHPKVAMDDNGNVVAVWERFDEGRYKLRYRVGKLRSGDASLIDWGDWLELAPYEGVRPCVALTNDGFVVAVYNSAPFANPSDTLIQQTGRLNPSTKTVTWEEGMYFDDGRNTAIAAAGKVAVRITQGEDGVRLWYSTSLITDRANWMRDRLPQLGGRSLKQLFIPGSHDAGMYLEDFSVLGKTQELTIYQQLAAGIRYFDLRVQWNDPVFHIHHGNINGPLLDDVLDQIANFCSEGHQELVILSFSHFEHFGDPATERGIYDHFRSDVGKKLSTWMCESRPVDQRLADIPLSDYLARGMTLLVVVDCQWAVKYSEPGFWVFRNSLSTKAEEGYLRVFDQFSSDANYIDVKNDQEEKFEKYNGYCDPDTDVPCDLFLLSWTCTSPVGVGVWQVSKEVNRHLGDFMLNLEMPNDAGDYPNILYVDYVEFARVTDVVLYANGTPLPAAVAASPHEERSSSLAPPPSSL